MAREKTNTESTAVKKILLVDDDPEIVETLRYVLEAKGHKIIIARDGNQGLAQWLSAKIRTS